MRQSRIVRLSEEFVKNQTFFELFLEELVELLQRFAMRMGGRRAIPLPR
jgi:hypothetical protein